MNGLEMIEKIHEINPECEIVIISGYDEFEFAKKAVSLGVREYLLKRLRRFH